MNKHISHYYSKILAKLQTHLIRFKKHRKKRPSHYLKLNKNNLMQKQYLHAWEVNLEMNNHFQMMILSVLLSIQATLKTYSQIATKLKTILRIYGMIKINQLISIKRTNLSIKTNTICNNFYHQLLFTQKIIIILKIKTIVKTNKFRFKI